MPRKPLRKSLRKAVGAPRLSAHEKRRREVQQEIHDEMIANRLHDAREAGYRFEHMLQSCDQPRELAALRRIMDTLSKTASKLPEPLVLDDHGIGYGGMP